MASTVGLTGLGKAAGARASVSWAQAGVAGATFLGLTLIATDNGGYWPTAWGWASLVLLWLIGLSLIVKRTVALGRLELVQLSALGLLLGWTLLSALWSSSPTLPFQQGERLLLYLVALAAVSLLARSTSEQALLLGVWAAIAVVCAYSLATELFPDRYGRLPGLRLQRPVGYWNSLGLFAAIGLILSVGLVARSRSWIVRAFAGASSVVLAATLYFTFSRGAWAALALGLLAALGAGNRRLQLGASALAIAPFPALAVWLASRQHALGERASPLAAATHEGHRMAWVILGLAGAAAVTGVVVGVLEPHVRPSRAVRMGVLVTLAVAVVAGVSAVLVHYGGPQHLARRGYHAFVAQPAPAPNLNNRIFDLSNNGRIEQWRVGWREYRLHPVLGSGAGSYAEYWNRYRPSGRKVLNAHSLYLETLAELGPVGLVLLLVGLAAPLVAVVKARGRPLAGVALGGYVAFLLHAGFDWDWQIPGVALAGLSCGAALLVGAGGRVPRRLAVPARATSVTVAAALAVAAAVALVGNSALAASSSATNDQSWQKAERDARRTTRWAPWSYEGWQALGEAQLQQGDLEAARQSFRRAIARDKKQWILWLDLALASQGQERTYAAKRALVLNPLSPEIAPIRPALGLSKE